LAKKVEYVGKDH